VNIVEIDGLYFEFRKMRGRRSTRGAVMLTRLLGAGVMTLLTSTQFEDSDERKRLETLSRLVAQSAFMGGKATEPDEFEAGANELLAWTSGHGGQGVSYCEEEIEPGAPGWVRLKNLSTLDAYDQVSYETHLALLWEVIKLNYRPISAVSGTNPGTGPAAATTPKESNPSAETTGAQNTQTLMMTGISGG